jgi:hypothetical protein
LAPSVPGASCEKCSGTLTASLASGYNPPVGTTADILTASSFGGSSSLPDGNFTTTNLPPGFSGTKVTPGEASPRYRLTKTAPVSSCAVGVCWDGEAGDNLWSTATNWSRDTLPTSSDTAYLNLLSGASVLLDDVQSIAALFSDSNNSLNIVRGGFLTLIDSSLSSSIQGALKVEGGDLALSNASVAFRCISTAVRNRRLHPHLHCIIHATLGTVHSCKLQDLVTGTRYIKVHLQRDHPLARGDDRLLESLRRSLGDDVLGFGAKLERLINQVDQLGHAGRRRWCSGCQGAGLHPHADAV